MSGYAISFDRVTYRPSAFASKAVLDNISLRIEAGEFVAIVGLNGAGKSSLLRAVSGEIIPQKGEVRVGGQRVTRPINQTIDGVGVVHQHDSPDLIDHLTVAQNIAIRQLLGGGHPNRLLVNGPRWRRRIASRLAGEANLSDYDLDELVLNLNGGRKQMLSVAIAVHFEHQANPCRLLLLDEHTSRLDHKRAVSVMHYTDEHARKAGATVLMVTHRYSDAVRYASRILIMDDAVIIADCPKSDFESEADLVATVEKRAA